MSFPEDTTAMLMGGQLQTLKFSKSEREKRRAINLELRLGSAFCLSMPYPTSNVQQLLRVEIWKCSYSALTLTKKIVDIQTINVNTRESSRTTKRGTLK